MDKLWNGNYVKALTANFMLYFSFMLIVPILPLYLADTYGAGKHTIGLVLSGYTVTVMLIRPFSGYIVDSFDRKKVLLVFYGLMFILFGGYLIGGSLILFTFVRTLHGAPYGATTIANSTVAIDVLPSSRRAEGIGYYGLSNNLATALSPSVGILIYDVTHDFRILFAISMLVCGIGLFTASTIQVKSRPCKQKVERPQMTLDRFFLTKGWSQALITCCFGLSYGVLSTYLAIYGRERLGDRKSVV